MATIKRKTLTFVQGGKRLFLFTLPAKDLRKVTKIDTYNPSIPHDDPKQGYQRAAEPARFKKFANYLAKTEAPLSPTALLLSSRGASLAYNSQTEEITINSDTPLHIVDGQHRAEGFSYAVYEKNKEHLADFEVPCIVVEGLDSIDEMTQFRVVNGSQKSVRMDLVNMILTQIQSSRGDDAVADADVWKVVVSRAIEILNTKPGSAWQGRIIMPNEKSYSDQEVENDPALSGKRVVRATSFITSLRPIYEYLNDHGFLTGERLAQSEKLADIINGYWTAVKGSVPEAFDDHENFVIQKTPGLFSLHLVLKRLLPAMHMARRSWTTKEFAVMIEGLPFHGNPKFWSAVEGEAGRFGSMKGFSELAELIWENQEAAAV